MKDRIKHLLIVLIASLVLMCFGSGALLIGYEGLFWAILLGPILMSTLFVIVMLTSKDFRSGWKAMACDPEEAE